MKNRFGLAIVLCLLSGLAVAVLPQDSTAASKDFAQQERFRRRSQLLLDNQDAVAVDTQTKKIGLDRKRLERKKTRVDDITFLQELTNFSNDVVEASKTDAGIAAAASKLSKYPKVKECRWGRMDKVANMAPLELRVEYL